MTRKIAPWLLLAAGGVLAVLGAGVQHSDRPLGLAISHFGALAAGLGVALGIVELVIGNLRPANPTYFYVSAIRADGVAVLVTGPYPSRAAAVADVDRVHARSAELDGGASDSYAWGVSDSRVRHEGKANGALGFQPVYVSRVTSRRTIPVPSAQPRRTIIALTSDLNTPTDRHIVGNLTGNPSPVVTALALSPLRACGALKDSSGRLPPLSMPPASPWLPWVHRHRALEVDRRRNAVLA